MKKKNKISEYYKKIKELWQIPRYHALIKLSLYGIMFLIIIIMANLYQGEINIDNKVDDNQKTYAEIVNSLDLKNCNIEYNIESINYVYKIEGKIENNILTGYLESSDIIKKITLRDGSFYQLINDTELFDEEINNNLDASLMLPQNIIDLVSKSQAYIDKESEQNIYTFKINNNQFYEVQLLIVEDDIKQINITNEIITYNIKVDFDKLS